MPESCASCGNLACARSYATRGKDDEDAITSFVVDEAWPEYVGLLAEQCLPRDQVVAPGIMGWQGPARYAWPGWVQHRASLATGLRHATLRQVRNKAGGVRQPAYLAADHRLALALGRCIDFRARHLVIQQNFLMALHEAGHLGGRSYDVLMTRYPLRVLQQMLDERAALHPQAKTIRDFRAGEEMVAQEWRLLAEARRIVTPHHGIARLFGEKACLLPWALPPAARDGHGDRVAFLGPTIARQGAFEVREVARRLQQPLLVFGADLEGADFWHGIAIERRRFEGDWLGEIGSILHPAVVTHQPRALLKALARGIAIFTSETSGLAPGQHQPFKCFKS